MPLTLDHSGIGSKSLTGANDALIPVEERRRIAGTIRLNKNSSTNVTFSSSSNPYRRFSEHKSLW